MISSVGIAARVFDTNGTLFIPRPAAAGAEQSRRLERRVSRTKTLDGGCVYYGTGYAEADRDITVMIPQASDAMEAVAQWLWESYEELTVCCDLGAFLCAPKGLSKYDGTLTLTLMVIERLDE